MSSRFPFGIPTGWFTVAYSADLVPGELKTLRYFDADLVLFRDADGKAVLLDAFCPHLGAHLGHGGKVEEGRVVCPFHSWEFDGTGRCVRIPYGDKIPPKAAVRSWTVDEKNGHVYAWHDAAGRPPLWELPTLPEVGDPDWTELRTATWTIGTCNQEMAENQVDAAHFFYVHGAAKMPSTTVVSRDGHHLVTRSTTAMTTPAGVVDGHIEVNAWGFGFSTTRFMGLVETYLLASATPIDAETTQMSFAFTVRRIGKGITGGVGKAFMAEISRQLEQDIPIWENKVYLDRPLLCDGDGPIGVFRQWARQFYPPQDADAARQSA
ncbi:MAG: Rieske (2Fe-2S) protein [Alphaproteobacteria bacterium]|nr:Rieske (2Fe-2S) protein [Alphaproteobacteria bacterium]